MNTSDQKWWQITVKARVSLRSTADGGRTQPVSERYRYSPNHKLADGLFCMGSFLRIQGGEVRPGEAALIDIVFVITDPFRQFLKEGFVWDIHEGSLKIGTGEILTIVEEKEMPRLIIRRIDQES